MWRDITMNIGTVNVIKVIKDVFTDYNKDSNILDMQIKQISLFKKTNILDLDLNSDKNISKIWQQKERLVA